LRFLVGIQNQKPNCVLCHIVKGGKFGSFWMAAIFVVLAVVGGLAFPAVGSAQTVTEVKAAFIYNFARFVDWPASAFSHPQAPLVIGVRQGDPMGPALQALSGKMVQGRPIRVLLTDKAEEFKNCQVVFLGRPADRRVLREILSHLPILTITDEEAEFKNLGAVINFIVVENRLRFEINQKAARRANLKISSQLLKLARLVDE